MSTVIFNIFWLFVSILLCIEATDVHHYIEAVEIAEGYNQFGFDLTEELYEDSKNVFISPFCISSCFSLVYPGSDGNTKTEIGQVLNYPTAINPSAITQQFFTLQSSIENTYNGLRVYDKKGSIIGIANKIYVSDDVKLQQAYIDTLDSGDESFIEYNFDFRANDATFTINQWVSDNTNKLIDTIIDENTDISEWQLAALNAIYLNGTFLQQFDTEFTSLNKFYTDVSRTRVEADIHLMHQFGYFKYYKDDNYQYLKFPFADVNDDLYILFTLPLNDDKTNNGLLTDSELLNTLAQWPDVYGYDTYLAVALPKISIEVEYTLKNTLQNMGMIDAFDPFVADFSKMSSDSDLFIDAVIHKTMVEMDEHGLVAAAVTVIGIVGLSMPPKPILFKADHPFQMFIIDGSHESSILFMGKINNPGIPNGSDDPVYDESKDATWTNVYDESKDELEDEINKSQENKTD